MRPDLVVVHSPVGGGHESAALATAEAATARGLRVCVLGCFAHGPELVGRAYQAAHFAAQGTLPWLYGAVYFRSNHRDGALEPLRHGFDCVAWDSLVRCVAELDPHAIIATHHLPLIVLGRARRRHRLRAPLVGVVTDYRAHAVWAEPDVDALCVPCHRALDDLIRHGFDAARVHMTGMPVRTAFERAAPVDDPPAGEALRVLVTGGGFGIGPVLAVARSFAGIADMELEVVCGRAPHLAAVVEQVARRTHTPAHVLGFERDMAARVAAAHVIVGKAGGLTVTESLAAGRPMVIAGSVPGNEILNARFVASAGAAVIAHPADVGRAAARLRATGGIARMGRRARQLAPGGAADRVVDVALSGAGAAADATPRLGPDALVVGDLQPESIRPIGERDFRSRSPIYTPRFV